jgi:hypothetical protein
MSNGSHPQLMLATFWSTMAQSARSHAAGAARRCGGRFAELILSEATKFCERATPTTDAELSQRTLRSIALTGKISSISHAAGAARRHPNIEDQILDETRSFCDRVSLTDDVTLESMAVGGGGTWNY